MSVPAANSCIANDSMNQLGRNVYSTSKKQSISSSKIKITCFSGEEPDAIVRNFLL
jgi:hypothetical protein